MKKKKEVLEPELAINGALVIKTNHGNIRQVVLDKNEVDTILAVARQMHLGSLKVSSKILEGITF